jgi:Holliday junction resolvase RusA-like endonuclease
MKIIVRGSIPSTSHIYKYRSTGKFLMGYMSAEGKEAKKCFQDEFTVQYRAKPLSCDLKLTVSYFWGDKRRRDIDNFSKLWMDAGTGILWEDDCQITELTLKKFYDKNNPRVEIEFDDSSKTKKTTRK